MTASLSNLRVATPKASGYLAQLSKHFGHKIDVLQTADETIFTFSDGRVSAHVKDDALVFAASAETDTQLRKVEQIIGSHLERFAFRENLVVTWPKAATTENGEI